MELGMIGLGRMGASMVVRLQKAGHHCVVYDMSAAAVEASVKQGATGAARSKSSSKAMQKPRAIWLMVPAGVVDSTLTEAGSAAGAGGHDHRWRQLVLPRRHSARRGTEGAKGIHYVDAGTSGGVWGADRGYCLMIGGEEAVVQHLDPIFASLAPGIDAPRTPGREKMGGTAEHGYLHCGPSGAGHFVKMVHNGIEYGMMASYAEGLNILRHANVGKHKADGRCGDDAAAPSGVLPVRPEHCGHSRRCGGAAAWWLRGCWTWRRGR
jgi:6-phosphogluconate dehydrogenase